MRPVQQARGLYLVRRAVLGKPGLWHYALIDVGGTLQLEQAKWTAWPVIIELTNHGPAVYAIAADQASEWALWEPVLDVEGARARVLPALRSSYDLLTSNCEHFARFVATGTYGSKQVVSAGVLAFGLLAILN